MTAAKRDAEPKTRMVRVNAGIVGAKVEEIEREVSADEPPPLGLNSELSVVGKRTPRIDGCLKVTGAAKYTADVRLPGMLFARMVTSPARAHPLD
jgi:xanthine dehydrogenase YagR molybdenum-binding subunit